MSCIGGARHGDVRRTARWIRVWAVALLAGATLVSCNASNDAAGDQPSPSRATAGGSPSTTSATSSVRVTVKFKEGTGVRLRGQRFASISQANLAPLQALLERHPGIVVQRVFERPDEELAQEKAHLEATSGRPQADKNLFFFLAVPQGVDAGGLVASLKSLSIVEDAYLAATASPPPG